MLEIFTDGSFKSETCHGSYGVVIKRVWFIIKNKTINELKNGIINNERLKVLEFLKDKYISRIEIEKLSFEEEEIEIILNYAIKREDKPVTISGRLGKIPDSHMAEYLAILKALNFLEKKEMLHENIIKIYTDSKLVFKQLTGLVKKPKRNQGFKRCYKKIIRLIKNNHLKCNFYLIPSSKNIAHKLANKAVNY